MNSFLELRRSSEMRLRKKQSPPYLMFGNLCKLRSSSLKLFTSFLNQTNWKSFIMSYPCKSMAQGLISTARYHKSAHYSCADSLFLRFALVRKIIAHIILSIFSSLWSKIIQITYKHMITANHMPRHYFYVKTISTCEGSGIGCVILFSHCQKTESPESHSTTRMCKLRLSLPTKLGSLQFTTVICWSG